METVYYPEDTLVTRIKYVSNHPTTLVVGEREDVVRELGLSESKTTNYSFCTFRVSELESWLTGISRCLFVYDS